jgi:hypothetical protein
VTLDDVGPEPGHDKNLADTGEYQPFDDVFQDRFALHLEHWFWNFLGEFRHPSALARRQYHRFHPPTGCRPAASEATEIFLGFPKPPQNVRLIQNERLALSRLIPPEPDRSPLV